MELSNPFKTVIYYPSDELKKYFSKTKESKTWIQVLTDPYVNALHLSLLPEREPPNKRRQHYLQGLINQLEEDGPDSLNSAQKRDLITDPGTLQSLHALFWSRPPANAGLLP